MGQIAYIQSNRSTYSTQDNDDVMIKTFTFSSQIEANRCFKEFTDEQFSQRWYETQIKWIQTVELPMQNQWKVIIGIQYLQQSIRSAIIEKKINRIFYSIKQLLLILELTAEFIILYVDTMCEHVDIYAYLFQNESEIKVCNPKLLYGTCARRQCRREIDKSVILRQILQVVLMEKIFQMNHYKILRKVHEQYHSSVLDNLLSNILKPETNLKIILSQYMQMKEELKSIEASPHPGITRNRFEYNIHEEYPRTPSFTTQFTPFPQAETPPILTPPRQSGLSQYHQAMTESIVKEDSNRQYIIQPLQNQAISMQNIRQERENQIKIESSSQGQGESEKTEIQPNQQKFVSQAQQEDSLKEFQDSIELVRVVHQEEEGRFEGYLKEGKKFGRGKLYYRNGMLFDGYWLNGKKNGEGSLFDANGKVCYHGSYRDDQQDGEGQSFNYDCSPIEGLFNYRDLTGIFQQNLWKRYKGGFRGDWIDGEGTLELANGEQFVGNWQRGIAHGHGQFTTLYGTVVKGFWSEGKLDRRLTGGGSLSSLNQGPQY